MNDHDRQERERILDLCLALSLDTLKKKVVHGGETKN
jgi:hypothetical protein